jgi:hypothetical protein
MPLVMAAGLAVTNVAAGCARPSLATESGRSGDFSFPYPTEGRPERIAIDHDD